MISVRRRSATIRPPTGGASDDSDEDAFLDILKAERRRIVLELLHEIQCEYDSDEVTVQVPDLARQVAAIEAAIDSATVGHTVKRGRVSDLFQQF